MMDESDRAVALWCSPRVSGKLNDALRNTAAVFDSAVGMAWSPSAAGLMRVEDGEPDHRQRDGWLDEVFEAYVFNERAQLSWRRDPAGGHFSLVSTDGVVDVDQLPAPATRREFVSSLSAQHLLWGVADGDGTDDGWTQFSDGRVGSYWVPVKGTAGHRAVLHAQELISEDQFGNRRVAMNRWTHITAEER